MDVFIFPSSNYLLFHELSRGKEIMEKQKSWFKKNWIIIIFMGLIVFGIIVPLFFGNFKFDSTGNIINEQEEITYNKIVTTIQSNFHVEEQSTPFYNLIGASNGIKMWIEGQPVGVYQYDNPETFQHYKDYLNEGEGSLFFPDTIIMFERELAYIGEDSDEEGYKRINRDLYNRMVKLFCDLYDCS